MELALLLAQIPPRHDLFFNGVRDVPITQAIAQTLEPIGSPMIGASGRGGFSLGLSADGARLLSGGVNSVLWDVAERTRIGDTFPGIQMWPGPDASDRGFSVEDGNILVWSLNTDEWYGIVCRAAGRNMTRVEWDEVGPSCQPLVPTATARRRCVTVSKWARDRPEPPVLPVVPRWFSSF